MIENWDLSKGVRLSPGPRIRPLLHLLLLIYFAFFPTRTASFDMQISDMSTMPKFIPNKGVPAYGKASSDASEPYKPQRTASADLGLENDQDNDSVPSINIARHDLSLITISEPFPQFKIKAATRYISKNIGKWKISQEPKIPSIRI